MITMPPLRERDKQKHLLHLLPEQRILPLRGKALRPETEQGTRATHCRACRHLNYCRGLDRMKLPVLCEDTALEVSGGPGRARMVIW